MSLPETTAADAHRQYELYIPESYSLDDLGLTADGAARLVLGLLAHFATRYEAWPVGQPDLMLKGALPAHARARQPLLEAVLAQVREIDARQMEPLARPVAVMLYRGAQPLIDLHDGPPPLRLWLTRAQYRLVQRGLARAGLPRDLYIPERSLRCVVEPAEMDGTVIRAEYCYTPREWRERAAQGPRALRVPTEAERRRALYQACIDFQYALTRRLQELHEPFRSRNEREIADLRALVDHVDRVTPPIGTVRPR